MSRKITAIRLSGGTTHQHITHLWWSDPSTSAIGDDTRARMVSWVEQGGKAYVEDRYGHRSDVRVVSPQFGEKYLRSFADGVPTDNLLALPRR